MALSEKKRIEIGSKAETDVSKLIDKISKQLGVTIFPYNNVYFFYPSVYGIMGKMSMQIDHIIITPYLIILVETKAAIFKQMDWKSFASNEWPLASGGKELSPIIQTQLHLKVFWNLFCKPLNIPMNKLIGVSCLTKMDNFVVTTGKTNNYILNNRNMDKGLRSLIAYTDETPIDVVKLTDIIEKNLTKKSNICDIHMDYIDHKDRIESELNSRKTNYKFDYTDSIRCSFCNKYMNYYIDKYNNMFLNCPDCFKNDKHDKFDIDKLPVYIGKRSEKMKDYNSEYDDDNNNILTNDITNKNVFDLLFYLK